MYTVDRLLECVRQGGGQVFLCRHKLSCVVLFSGPTKQAVGCMVSVLKPTPGKRRPFLMGGSRQRKNLPGAGSLFQTMHPLFTQFQPSSKGCDPWVLDAIPDGIQAGQE